MSRFIPQPTPRWVGHGAILAFGLFASAAVMGGDAHAQSIVAAPATETQSEVEAYWTPERLQAARPLIKRPSGPAPTGGEAPQREGKPERHLGQAPNSDLGEDPIQLFTPAAAPDRARPDSDIDPHNVGTGGRYFTTGRVFPKAAVKAYPNRAAGKLFFTDTVHGGDYVCSASVIAYRVVVTAGHCVAHASTTAPHFYANFLFVPSYSAGAAPFKTWTWSYVVTTNNWYNSNGSVPNVQDVGMLVVVDQVYKQQIRRIGEVTGWLGWWTLWGRDYPNNHITQLGYPCNLDSCSLMEINNAQSGGDWNNTIMIGSAMRGGSSGGPWIQDHGVYPVGGPTYTAGNWVLGVTSWGYNDPAIMIQGASRFENAGYPGGGFGDLWNAACAQATGNC